MAGGGGEAGGRLEPVLAAPPPGAFVVLAFFVAVGLAVAASTASSGGPWTALVVVLVFFVAVPVAAAVYMLGQRRAAGRLLERIQVTPDGQLVAVDVELEPVYLEAAYERRGRSSRRGVRLEPRASRGLRLDPTGYAMVRSSDGVYIRVPGWVARSSCCQGALLVYTPPEPSHCLPSLALQACSEEACAQARLEGCSGGRLHATLHLHPAAEGGGVRAARLELEARPPSVGHARPSRARVKIAEATPDKPVAQEGYTYHQGPRVAVAPPSPPVDRLAEALGLTWETPIQGLGPGPGYRLRLVIDRPLKRDVVAEEEAEPTPID